MRKWLRSIFVGLAVILLMAVIAVLVVSSPVSLDPEVLTGLEKEVARHQSLITKQDYYIVIDYDLPIYRKRLWVIEAESGDVVLHSHVSHAWNSGILYATDFSNEDSTYKSCPGVFVTGESYDGEFGYAMRIDGLEDGVNDRARPRFIVFHGCKCYRWPWSLGCFMTLPDINKQLIDMVHGGTLLYVHVSQ